MAKRNVDDHNSMETKGQWTESDSIPEEVSSYFPKWEIISSERQTLFELMGFWGNEALVSASGTGVLTWTSLFEDLLFLETIYTVF